MKTIEESKEEVRSYIKAAWNMIDPGAVTKVDPMTSDETEKAFPSVVIIAKMIQEERYRR